jgi:hypothetical protein
VELAVNGSQWPMSYGERKIVGGSWILEWIVEAVNNYYWL